MAYIYTAWVWMCVQWYAVVRRFKDWRADWNGKHYIVLLGHGHINSWPAFAGAVNAHIKDDQLYGQAPHMAYVDALNLYRERCLDAPWSRIYNTKRQEYIAP